MFDCTPNSVIVIGAYFSGQNVSTVLTMEVQKCNVDRSVNCKPIFSIRTWQFWKCEDVVMINGTKSLLKVGLPLVLLSVNWRRAVIMCVLSVFTCDIHQLHRFSFGEKPFFIMSFILILFIGPVPSWQWTELNTKEINGKNIVFYFTWKNLLVDIN